MLPQQEPLTTTSVKPLHVCMGIEGGWLQSSHSLFFLDRRWSMFETYFFNRCFLFQTNLMC